MLNKHQRKIFLIILIFVVIILVPLDVYLAQRCGFLDGRVSEKIKPVCGGYSSENCSADCAVCPPCLACSSLSCQTKEFCDGLGFGEKWRQGIGREPITEEPIASSTTVCKVENCHGLDIKCGPNPPEACTMMYALGDKCLPLATCGVVDGECQVVKNVDFSACKACVDKCLTDFQDDQPGMFDCESNCQ
jgi:hypothetical protein